MLRFAVFEESGKLLGQRILPLDGLQAGYRHISLRTETNLHMTLPTLFCNIVLRTYIPEGLSNWVDALADPKGYLYMIKKRQKQMEAMGIKQEDIGEVPSKKGSDHREKGSSQSKAAINCQTAGIGSSGSAISTSSGGAFDERSGANSARSSDKQLQQPSALESVKSDPIRTEELKLDKVFQKLLQKQVKDLDSLKSKHLKVLYT